MAAFQLLTATRIRNFFIPSFKRLNGVAQLATIDDVNGLAGLVNTIAKNTTSVLRLDYLITTTIIPGSESFTIKNAAQPGGGTISCSDPAALCVDSGDCCGSTKAYKCSNCTTSISLNYVSNGVYTLGILGDPADINESSIMFGQPSVPALITVTKVSPILYNIQVLDLTTPQPFSPAAGLLTDTLLTVNLYPSVQGNSWLAD